MEFTPVVALGALSTWSYVAIADQDSLLNWAMEKCFRAHARLMDKPAMKNVQACWRTHSYRMERVRGADLNLFTALTENERRL